LFSREHCSFASSSSRSFCLARAAANSGSCSAAFLVFSSRDSEARASVGTVELDGSEEEGAEVDGATEVEGAAWGGEGEAAGVGMLGVLLGVLFTTGGALLAVFCFLASFRTLWSTVN